MCQAEATRPGIERDYRSTHTPPTGRTWPMQWLLLANGELNVHHIFLKSLASVRARHLVEDRLK